jgi:hypothetical protein
MNRGERKLNFNLISPWTKVTLNGKSISGALMQLLHKHPFVEIPIFQE